MMSKTIVVAVGGEFSERLTSTPSTGYLWVVHELPKSIQLLGSTYENPASGIRPGDPGTQVFRFRVLKAGEHIITFALKRQWERDAVESHTLTVKAN
ncbi:MAG: hypothetical protein OJF51_002980 [Nitrospira sp.]|jgi:predicted secreted protein|nr:MAG: hypothetical protein OJF51_002980 [Nitrospira sp.]